MRKRLGNPIPKDIVSKNTRGWLPSYTATRHFYNSAYVVYIRDTLLDLLHKLIP